MNNMQTDEDQDDAARPIWHCVLDQDWRLLYLGVDRSEAIKSCGPESILKSSRRMGDAMLAAAKEVGRLRRAERGRR